MEMNCRFFRPETGVVLLIAVILVTIGGERVFAQDSYDPLYPPQITELLADQPMTRAGRPFVILATIQNPSEKQVQLKASLVIPDGVDLKGNSDRMIDLGPGGQETLRWTISAERPLYGELVLNVSGGGTLLAVRRLPVRFLPQIEKTNPDYIPEPVPVKKNSNILVGAHNCPLWEYDAWNPWYNLLSRVGISDMWSPLMKHPERTPALGFYAQENPEVADWETKWAVEHGVDYFIYCWYRDGQGGPVKQRYGSALHDALFNSRYQDQIKFTIMWENQIKGTAGVSDEEDLMKNLMPFWMENYFKRSNYLVMDNKPVLFIYRPEFLVDDLGSIGNVRKAFGKMREACRKEGFDGLYIFGEYRGLDMEHLELMKSLDLDYTFAYCWPVKNSPAPYEAISEQMEKIRTTQELGIIPQVVTVSQGWSGWRDEGSIWTLPPTEFETLLRQARAFVETLPEEQLGARMLILDNWNEWGEGHYLLPYTEYGFGYLDAIRRVFSDSPEEHTDLIPEDLGMGPYETAYREWLAGNRKEKAKDLSFREEITSGNDKDMIEVFRRRRVVSNGGE